MIITRLNGGLGNQMFQYAVGSVLAKKHNTKLLLDITSFKDDKLRNYALDSFCLNAEIALSNDILMLRRKHAINRRLKKLGLQVKPYWFIEKGFNYDPDVLNLPDNIYLEGFWQSEKYFMATQNQIRKEFSFKNPPTADNARMIEKAVTSKAVSLHIRRGDYITDKKTNEIHGVCDADFYLRAIHWMVNRYQNTDFFVFSDDLIWARENLPANKYNFHFMDHNKGDAHEDLRLMTFCRHFIIANSSFSWWGAWLNENPGKEVIAPSNWFQSQYINNDIIPEKWNKI